MYALILAGGSGARLWPLSREQFPKQYLALGGSGHSLFQETVLRVLPAVSEERITVVTHRDQHAEIGRQLALLQLDQVKVIAEPEARNTAPAIALAAWRLEETEGPGAVMAVLPSDHLIRPRAHFVGLLSSGAEAAKKFGLVTFGIRPGYPETGYGYIRCGESLDETACRVDRFVEKPDRDRAEEYFRDGRYLWNSGMFVFDVSELIKNYRLYLPQVAAAMDALREKGESALADIYREIDPVSIDYGILERAQGVAVIPADITWNDVGSWEAYYRVSPKDERGNVLQGRVIAGDTQNSMIIAGPRLVGVTGMKDTVIVDTADALLVCPMDQSQSVRDIVEELKRENAPEYRGHLTVNRPWGSFTTLEKGEYYQVKRITVTPGQRLSLQSHRYRSEHWVVVSGIALVTVDEQELALRKGENVFIPAGARHRLQNTGEEPLEVIEVQNGSYLGEDDIKRFDDDYGRGGDENSPAHRRYRQWLQHPDIDRETLLGLQEMDGDKERIKSCFGGELAFGTGGMRGVIGPGLNRMNKYVVRRATQGLAGYINNQDIEKPKVAVAYDNRHCSREFALETALVLAANGIKALLFDGIRPTPELSFATREFGCAGGVVITASHNPPAYNGYKIYGPDGGQAVSPLIDGIVESIASVDIFRDVKTILHDEAVAAGLLEYIGQAVDDSYLEAVRSLSMTRPRSRLKVVYTPLHGTGAILIPQLLRGTGFVDLAVVEEQMVPDPDFSTVESPNPEEAAAFAMALDLASREDAALVLATDPDGDRVGCAVRNEKGSYVHLNGNQTGALLLEYMLGRMASRGELPANGVMVKTIVTGNLGQKVAGHYGVETVETLTGFKFIGEKIREFEETGEHQFLFGYEESYGYLAGTFARDKDAVGTAFLLAEAAAYYQDQGRTLLDLLEELSRRHGYFREGLDSIQLKDMAEADGLMQSFQEMPPAIDGLKVAERRDYDRRQGRDLLQGRDFPLTLPRSPVLFYRMEDESWFCVRPSGTEPKVKIYFSTSAASAAEAESKLARFREAVLAIPGITI